MKISVNLYFNNNIDTKSKLDLIKRLGYDEFFTGVNSNKETLSLIKQIAYAKSIGLGLTMIHCSYDENILDNFWKDNELGDKVENSYIQQIEQCGKYTKNFVVHLNASKDVKPTEIGLKRIKNILTVCEKYGCNLAVENLYSKNQIPYIFNNLSHSLLKICFDCGHQNFLTKDFDLLKEYGNYVTVLHLHDNNGLLDEHKIIGTGTIDFEKLSNQLSELDNVVYSAEIRYKNAENLKDILLQNKIQLLKLAKKRKNTKIN